MNLSRIYNNVVMRAKEAERLPSTYYEHHHIIPRCLGGTDEDENLVYLTLREHFFCHQLLARIYGGKLAVAAWLMANHKKKYQRRVRGKKRTISSRARMKLKEMYLDEVKLHPERYPRPVFTEEVRKKISDSKKGLVRTEEHRRKLSEAMTGKPSPRKGIKTGPLTGERLIRQREIMKEAGKCKGPVTEETRQKMSKSRTGIKMKPHTEETKAQMSQSHLNVEKVTCPYCHRTGHPGAMGRWHFENCKHKG